MGPATVLELLNGLHEISALLLLREYHVRLMPLTVRTLNGAQSPLFTTRKPGRTSLHDQHRPNE